MVLKKFKFSSGEGTKKHWSIDELEFGGFNLIVGQNAIGKTRLLDAIVTIVQTISAGKIFSRVMKIHYEFIDGETIYKYKLETNENGEVVKEHLTRNKEELLIRDLNSSKIFAEKKKKMDIFNPPKNKPSFQVRRDVKEYPYFEKFSMWAGTFLIYGFTEDSFLELMPDLLWKFLDKGSDKNIFIDNMKFIGYDIKDIGVKKTGILGESGKEILYLYVKEKKLQCDTDQPNMSPGMHRAIAILIVIESVLSIDVNFTIAIDDLGEGLDYERATKLMKLLIEKIKGSKVQLIITSNDRFLINAVDVENITVLERDGHKVKVYNYHNSKEAFDNLKLVGLNSFDLLSRKMYKDEYWEDME